VPRIFESHVPDQWPEASSRQQAGALVGLVVGCLPGVLASVSPGMRPALIVVLCAAVTYYFLFQAPVWCGPVTRDGTLCRRNSSGLLMGCSYRQHEWQRARMAVVPRAWRRLNDGLWDDLKTCLATAGMILAIISTVVRLVRIPFG
jgi:hypothetical protein